MTIYKYIYCRVYKYMFQNDKKIFTNDFLQPTGKAIKSTLEQEKREKEATKISRQGYIPTRPRT